MCCKNIPWLQGTPSTKQAKRTKFFLKRTFSNTKLVDDIACGSQGIGAIRHALVAPIAQGFSHAWDRKTEGPPAERERSSGE